VRRTVSAIVDDETDMPCGDEVARPPSDELIAHVEEAMFPRAAQRNVVEDSLERDRLVEVPTSTAR
jgi:hypothetical protein